ncbi:MAG: hypothetical protein ACI8S6_000763 [Myxococcota bacterium]|jgi:hypothetical protein
MMHHIFWLLQSSAWALTPPPGWTPTSPDRAERVSGDPSQGVLLEILGSGDGSSSSLSLRLVERGLSIRQATIDDQERLNLLLLDGRLGRALWDGEDERWLVVLVAPSHAPELDPDALLQGVLSVPAPEPSSVWGSAEPTPEALSGGGDGSPWGAGAAGAATEGWVSASSVESWGHDDAMLGIWECSMLLGGAPTQLIFTFEPDGTVRLEKQVSGRAERHVGHWSTRGESLRLESLPDVGEGSNTYQVLGGTLRFSYDRTRLTLYRQ